MTEELIQDLSGIKDMWDVEILVGVKSVNKYTRYDMKNGYADNQLYISMI
jgi:hypothetical protein